MSAKHIQGGEGGEEKKEQRVNLILESWKSRLCAFSSLWYSKPGCYGKMGQSSKQVSLCNKIRLVVQQWEAQAKADSNLQLNLGHWGAL